jgi:hypothetical protein
MSDPYFPSPYPVSPLSPVGDANSVKDPAANGSSDGSPAASVSPAVVKFKSCRWRRPPEDGPECCGHRDVLPIAGTSFNPDAWCPDCAFFKLRRTPKKRSPEDYRY